MVNSFQISVKPPASSNGDHVGKSFARLKIEVGGNIVTRYEGDFEPTADDIEIPTYFFAEWLSENWWSILWEPRKSETEGDDYEFLTRHSTIFAQGGFVLPKIMFVQQGGDINVHAYARNLQYPDIRFRNGGNALLPRASVEAELTTFVRAVVKQIGNDALDGTSLLQHWCAIENTEIEETLFCKLMGALGLSPYIENSEIEKLIETSVAKLGEELALDLCLAANPKNLSESFRAASTANALLNSISGDLSALLSITAPADGVQLPGWRRGVQGARKVRNALGISEDDPRGSDLLFAALGINIDGAIGEPRSEDEPVILGAVCRENSRLSLGLTQPSATKRRFTAARAAFAAWTAETPTWSKLLTLAVTRDQQASRAFAAEMTAPIAFIKKRAHAARISDAGLYETASDLQVSAEVVRNQAMNNGLTITRI